MSFDRILSFLNELSQTVRVLFNESDNKVLPSALRKGIFTIFVDDNVDKNSPGRQRQRKRFLELTSDERVQACNSLAAFTTVLPIKGKVNATYAVETVSIPDAFRECLDTITHHELKNEDNWLEVACGDVEEGPLTQPTSWTAHHKSKARVRSENISTIQCHRTPISPHEDSS